MMQTPISFALEILLDCETIEEAHKKCRKYIKLLEAKEAQSHKPQLSYAQNITQSPSTQRLLEQQAAVGTVSSPPIIARTAGAEVNNGDGTRGRRKW